MGDIIHKFEGFDKPVLHMKRRVDKHTTEELHMSFIHGHDSWLSTETENSLDLFCRDEDGNTIEVNIPVSVKELKKALEEYDKQ